MVVAVVKEVARPRLVLHMAVSPHQWTTAVAVALPRSLAAPGLEAGVGVPSTSGFRGHSRMTDRLAVMVRLELTLLVVAAVALYGWKILALLRYSNVI